MNDDCPAVRVEQGSGVDAESGGPGQKRVVIEALEESGMVRVEVLEV